ncbi:hypothetical protein Tco_0782521 [Tanacetum coccineum]
MHKHQILSKRFSGNYVQSNVIQVHPTTTTSTETTSSADLQQQLYFKMKRSLQDQANDPALWEVLKRKFEKSLTSNTSCRDDDIHSHHDDHQEDDAPPEGEKRVKRHKLQKDQSLQGVLHLSIQLKIHNIMNPNEPPSYLYNKDLFFLKYENTKEKKYILSLHKIHAERFPEVDLEEKMNRWVHKEFKNFNEEARLTIQHWKDSWHKMFKITTDQPHGLDFMEQILVMRENDKLDSFSEADFKYLNKNNIEDLYYLCQSNKLGIESYQIKVNITAPTLTFPSIEACEPHLIVDKPNTGMIYLNSKDEKWVMCLVEIVKFCDATHEKVLKEVKLKIFQSETLKKPPLLGELDRDIMRAFEREITKRLNHREHMRIWESFMNRRLILPTMKHL